MGAFSDNKENCPVCERVNERPLTESEPYAAALQENQALQAVLPHILPISESDLCVLLSNALENALHACKGADDSIEVQTYERNGKFFLQVVNDCREAVRFKDGIPVTDRPGHGIGVSSICAIVERYGGLYSFSVREGKIVLRVSL